MQDVDARQPPQLLFLQEAPDHSHDQCQSNNQYYQLWMTIDGLSENIRCKLGFLAKYTSCQSCACGRSICGVEGGEGVVLGMGLVWWLKRAWRMLRV